LSNIAFPPAELPASASKVRESIRSLINQHKDTWPVAQRARSWTGVDYAFTRALGENGFIGMCWPKQYGGGERSALERYVVVEELLAAGAPVALHWAADRQIGPMLLRCGTELQRQRYLPGIVRGEEWFCLGMSEPNSGSDLASVSTFAAKEGGGYRITGSKIWTSGADRAQNMLLFCRTAAKSENRHAGFSQLIVPLDAPGVEVTPIMDLSGHRTFNQVFLTDVFVPAENLVGEEGNGWEQVTSELSLERSGPDRFLSAFALLQELANALSRSRDAGAAAALGRLVARLYVLRAMSVSVAGMLERQEDPALQASIVKDLGALLEQDIPETVRDVVDLNDPQLPESLKIAARETMLIAPAYPLRGGTREVLRGMIARGLGLR
jgi:alkylation response protein AidB-like acyl-CoA dehydrogenase